MPDAWARSFFRGDSSCSAAKPVDFWTRGFGAGRSRTEDGGLDFGAKTQAAGRPEADGEGTSWPRRSPPKRVTEVRLDGKVAVLGCQAVSGWRWQWFRGVSANGGLGVQPEEIFLMARRQIGLCSKLVRRWTARLSSEFLQKGVVGEPGRHA